MELRNYRVYLGGKLLKNIPQGLDTFQKEFQRDNDLFGVYSVSSFNLIFVGDGYCILRDFQNDLESCKLTIRIEQKCNNIWVTKFTGIIELGSVVIDESASEATCEMQDDNPLNLIIQNASVDIDLQSTKSLFGNPITPITQLTDTLFSPTNSLAYANRYFYDAKEVIRFLLEAITEKTVNVTSTFLTKNVEENIWEIQYTGNLANIVDTIITFKNFQGDTVTVTANNAFGGATETFITGYYLMPFSPYLGATAGVFNYVQNAFKFDFDHRGFFFFVPNQGAKKVTLYCNLPIEILSVSVNSFGPETVTANLIQEYSDGGNNPCVTNYNLISGFNDPARFPMSFKTIMEELHKLYNVYFIANYDNDGNIDIRIEDYQYFANAPANIVFDNAENLKISIDEETAAITITTGEAVDTTLGSNEFTFGSEFCGLGKDLDVKNDFVIGSYQIFEDLRLTYDQSKENQVYFLENNAEKYSVWFTALPPNISWAYRLSNAYNLHYTNYHKIYRHFNKFRKNILGSIVIPDNKYSSSINISNTADNRLFRNYQFNEFMGRDEFNSLFDNISDKAKFKRKEDTVYKEGLIKSAIYNDFDGSAEITILGE